MSLDSLTEPRKLTAAMHGLIGVSRALVSGHKGYTEGRTHVIPLFLATLPGIDGNDQLKTGITFHFLTSVAFLIPIIDCSQAGQYHTNLTDDERLLCEQTADFGDFTLQYLDRLFLLIENSSTNNVRMEQSDLDTARSKAESLLEPMVQTCTHGIMGQASEPIIAAAAKKLMEFVQTRLFEPNVAGQLVGCLVRLFARIHGKEVLRVLLPHVLRLIEEYMEEHENVEALEKHNDEMLYYLVLLMNLVRGDPQIFRNYVDDVLPTVDRLARFKCKRVSRYVAQIVGNLMNNMSTLQTMDVRNIPDCFHKPLSEVVPVKRWGEKMTPDSKIEWRIPDEGGRLVCERILHRYLPPLLEKLDRHSAGELKTFNSTKRFQTYQLTRCKRDVRAVVVTRVIIQQDCRDEMKLPYFSATHLQVLKKLLELSVSYYSTVRIDAQAKLHDMLYLFPYAYPLLTDRIVECLQLDSNTHHEQFKGILCLLFIKRRGRLITQNNWGYLARVWPALLRSKLSEKTSIVSLVDGLKKMIDGQSPTYLLEVDIGEKVVERALALRTRADELDLEAGKLARERENKRNMALFQQLVGEIVQTVETSKLHLRYHYLASVMLINLCHPYAEHPPSVTNLAVHHLIHDSVIERKLAIQLMLGIFRQQKRPQKKIVMNPLEIVARVAGKDPAEAAPNPGSNVAPGYRDDNMWLQYDVAKVPTNQQEWDEPRYMYTSEGCFGWTKRFKVYAPSAEQPKLNRTVDEMNEHERTIFAFFDQQENIDTLMRFWSLEEKKGRDEFSSGRMLLIKMVMKVFGDRLLDRLLSHMTRLIQDKATEGNHRCAVEVMTGVMRGAKHWPYEMTRDMYARVVPLIRLGMQNVTVDTDVYWGMCFATAAQSMDPSKQYWLHEVLMEDPLQDANSFSDCNRLYCLQGAFNQHVWRMASVAHRLLAYLKPHLDHPFQSLRERLGNTLINIFEADLRFEGYESRTVSPQRSEMFAYVMPKLAILLQKDPEPPKPKTEKSEEKMELEEGASSEQQEDSEYVKAVRLFKTIAHWVTYTIHRYSNGNEKEYFELLPIACRLERSEHDQELSEICTLLLAFISQALTLPNCMDVALAKIDEVSKMSFWSARRAVIDVLQVQVFYNMTIILSRPEWKAKVQEIVLRLLEDSVVEVREKAAEVLCGLVHCSFLTATEELLELFKRKC
uniref:Uncharacterized protein n=1 Tax=Anopheles maculatus TaxID=74869 RepID=A0A182T359_9DIPT